MTEMTMPEAGDTVRCEVPEWDGSTTVVVREVEKVEDDRVHFPIPEDEAETLEAWFVHIHAFVEGLWWVVDGD